jgi:hypothetical protein
MAFAVGMADVIAIHCTLLANFTKLTHGNPPPCGVKHIKPVYDITFHHKLQGFFSQVEDWFSNK